MDVVGQWAERIAQRFTPAEASFAAEVGMAYAAGGSRRRDLLPRYDVQPGAFGPGGAAELPMILHALAGAYTVLQVWLGSPYLANALAVGSLLTALQQSRHPGSAGGDEGPSVVSHARSDGVLPEAVEAASAVPVNEKQAIEHAFDTLSRRLQDAGFDQARASELACGLAEELLSDAAEAVSFLDALTAVPEEGELRRKRRIFRHKDPR